MRIQEFFDPDTYTLTYVVYDEASLDAVIIDPVLDFDPAAGRITLKSAQRLMSWIKEQRLRVHYSLETHAHADHLSASQYFRNILPGCRVGIGDRIREVQVTF